MSSEVLLLICNQYLYFISNSFFAFSIYINNFIELHQYLDAMYNLKSNL